jgi:hypothetical protein
MTAQLPCDTVSATGSTQGNAWNHLLPMGNPPTSPPTHTPTTACCDRPPQVSL